MIAAAYIRESKEEQARTGYGPDFQLRQIRDHADRAGLDLPADLVFADAQSGTTDRREGFQALMAAAEAGRFAVLLVWHSSRLFRDRELARRYRARCLAGFPSGVGLAGPG